MPKKKKKLENTILAVDFDGTCVAHEFPKVGKEIGAAAVLRELVKEGAKLVLWTVRDKSTLMDAKEWFDKNRIPLYGVNNNPSQIAWNTSRKVFAHYYIDDMAIGAPLIQGDDGARPHIDWQVVRNLLLGSK